ncbi:MULTISPECIES: chromate transporter [Ktedonobacter]|uniref:Chromate transporter n=1 Tax=Ktedonobacter robiniae TaxID=2778365 RepID=A0ABQ3UZX8_9CHLR|nr:MULTISPECIES: chromate transporter [Ktedonobacter]GHO58097.1 hypothetical protein KSB_65720 [Ktedonobacter robiniae]GHO70345.1 hypothetical protein KSC_092370 [Ktedonobacter sp. SOSP1-52]
MNPFIYFLLFFKASLFSFGSVGNLASLHRDLLSKGWAREANFGEALAIGQFSPGSNGLWTVSLGYLTYGLPGAGLALLSLVLPPLLILPLEAAYHRIEHQAWAQAVIRSLSLVSIGILLSAAWSILDGRTIDIGSVLICLAACALCMNRRIGSFLTLLLAMGAGYLLYGLH